MKQVKWCGVVLLTVLLTQGTWAAEGSRPVTISNRILGEWDDNVYQRDTDKKGSFRLVEQVEFAGNLNLENTFLSVRYRPTFEWFSDRDPKTDVQHEFDFILNQTFGPRFGVSVVDTFRRGELPELMQNDVVVRVNDNFYYNTFNATLGYVLRPETRVDLAGRYVLLRYDNELVATNQDYNLYVAGLTVRQELSAKTAVLGELREEIIDYTGMDRGSKATSAGLGLEQIFSPNLVGAVHGGNQWRTYEMDSIKSSSTPYGDANLTFIVSPATRLTVGGAYVMDQTDIGSYASQKRITGYGSLAYDITARVSWYLTGSYTKSKLSAEQALAETDATDGTENVYQASTSLNYKINRSNWLEAQYQYLDLNSDLRTSFVENRYSLAWRTQL